VTSRKLRHAFKLACSPNNVTMPNRSIELQPLSIEGSTGLNIALGVAELRLQAAQ
jgi:hypothetical protein